MGAVPTYPIIVFDPCIQSFYLLLLRPCPYIERVGAIYAKVAGIRAPAFGNPVKYLQ